jgi:Protein of unknown function (DUF3795)
MSAKVLKNVMNIRPIMIAPCGMNCGICRAYLRDRNRCIGCNIDGSQKANHCSICSIKACDERAGASFCFDCNKYPCTRLEHLDQRYITKYGMSMIQNLDQIKEIGLKRFMEMENTRWVCPECGSPICIHNKKCYICGKQYSSPIVKHAQPAPINK